MEDLDTLVKEQRDLDEEVARYAVKVFEPFFAKRDEFASKVPDFWPNAIYRCEALHEFISLDDWTYIKQISSISVSKSVINPRKCDLCIEFQPQSIFGRKFYREFEWKVMPNNADEGYYTGSNSTGFEWSKYEGEENKSVFKLLENKNNKPCETRDKFTRLVQILSEDLYINALDLYKNAFKAEAHEEEYEISE